MYSGRVGGFRLKGDSIKQSGGVLPLFFLCFLCCMGCGSAKHWRVERYPVEDSARSARMLTKGVLYHLPQTVLTLQFTVVRNTHVEGPYAEFAQRFLGVPSAPIQTLVKHAIVAVHMDAYAEADPQAAYLLHKPHEEHIEALQRAERKGELFLSQGVHCKLAMEAPSGNHLNECESITTHLYEQAAVESPEHLALNTYYSVEQRDSTLVRVPMQREVLVYSDKEAMARKVAKTIFTLRQTRLEFLSGEGGAALQGKALQTMLAGLTKLEKEYLALFMGVHIVDTLYVPVSVIPQADNTVVVPCRFSENHGIRPADDPMASPLLLEFNVNPMQNVASYPLDKKIPKGKYVARMAFPVESTLRYGQKELLSVRLPIYQLGRYRIYPWAHIENAAADKE